MRAPSLFFGLFVVSLVACGGGGGGGVTGGGGTLPPQTTPTPSHATPTPGPGVPTATPTPGVKTPTPTPTPTPIQGTDVEVAFNGIAGINPVNYIYAASGTGAFSPLTLRNGTVGTLIVPTGTTTYTIAYVCNNQENIVTLSINDTTTPAFGCLNAVNTYNGNVTYDASGVTNATSVNISSSAFVGGGIFNQSVSGTANLSANPLTTDVFIQALGTTGNVLAAKFFPDLGISNSLVNVGSITSAADAATTHTVMIGGSVPAIFRANFITVNGGTTLIATSALGRTCGTSSCSYTAIPTAEEPEPTDVYTIDARKNIGTQQVATQETIATAADLNLPAPATFSPTAPTPAVFPTIQFAYGGFAAPVNVESYQIMLSGLTGANGTICYVVTAKAIGSNPSLTIPDLSSVSPLIFPAPAHGSTVTWTASVQGTSPAIVPMVLPNPHSGDIIETATAMGAYTVP